MKNANSLWLVAAAFFFSCMTITTRYCGKDYSFYDLMFAKYLLTTLLLLVLVPYNKISFKTELPLLMGGRCAFGVLTAAINTYLITQLPAAIAQSFNYTAAFWIVLVLFVVSYYRGQKFPWIVFIPVLIGFSGILLILDPRFEALSNTLLFICLSYGFCSAGSSLFLKRLGSFNEPALRIAFYFSLSCTLFGALLAAFYGSQNLLIIFTDPVVWLSVLFALLYQIAKTYGWEHGNPFINSVFMFLGIPFVLVLGYIFLGEFPRSYQLVGISLILISSLFCYLAIGKFSTSGTNKV